MIRFLLTAALVATASTAGAEPDQPGKSCLNTGLQTAGADSGAAASLRRLDTLPPAAEILTVIRAEGGCMKPVVVRYGIAGNPRAVPPCP